MREIKWRQPLFNRDGTFELFLYWGFINGMFIEPDTHSTTIADAGKNSQQFTGLTDKDGTPIFEGDIVEIDEETRKTFGIDYENGEVKYFHGSYFIGDDSRARLYVLTDIHGQMRGKIIGNIHETNPKTSTPDDGE